MMKLFRTAYFLAKKERPFSDFPELLQLQNLNGLNLGKTYNNDKSAKVFIENIAQLYKDELKELLNSSNYFSVFCVMAQLIEL